MIIQNRLSLVILKRPSASLIPPMLYGKKPGEIIMSPCFNRVACDFHDCVPAFSALHFSLVFLLMLMAVTLPCNGLSLEGRILYQIKETQWIDKLGLLSNWNESDEDPCLWNGVHCMEFSNFSKVVTQVNLTRTFISGNLTSVICGLQNLRTLILRRNKFGGPFPDGLLECRRLEMLDLSHNQFVGVLPNRIFELRELKHLDLSRTRFSGRIPPGFGMLSKIEVLHLGFNLLDGTIPAFLGNVTSLVSLKMMKNPFAPGKIPEELGNLQSIRELLLWKCNLVGKIPSSLGNLSQMSYMDLGDNKLSGNIPESLMALPRMWQLVLTSNSLSGSIPSNVGELKSIKILDLSRNKLSGRIPEGIGNLTYLEDLLLFRNQLSGPIPPQLDQLQYLKYLRIFENKLTGLLPQNLGTNSKLLGVDASSNSLWGPIPQNLCRGGMFVALYVLSNNLNGTLPSSLASCTSLVALGASENRLSGEVPLGLWSSPNLTFLQLFDNSFEGRIPPQIAKSNLSCLDIAKNRFSGSIPAEIGQLQFLSILKASNNRLSGSIPEELTGLDFLSILLLDDNLLSLEIPRNIISWQSLYELNLSNNQLTGSIPATLGSLSNLKILDLSNNLFRGRIPSELGNLSPSVLNLSGNQLSGAVPVSLNNVAYNYSFLDNQELCGGGALGLPDCLGKVRETSHMWNVFAGFLVPAATIICTILLFRLYNLAQARLSEEKSTTPWNQVSFHGLRFDESEIFKKLTENNVISFGGSGIVYRVTLDSGEVVAVKKICSNRRGKLGDLGEKEFNAEMEILGSRTRHKNVVKLLCCISRDELKLLVYEYMPKGNLLDCLNGNGTSRELLQWPVRHKIAMTAARGLCYIQHDCSPPILHRDIKSANILLDAEFEAKIADFGLARNFQKLGQKEDSLSVVAGSYGYIAPEYAYSMKVNEKSDIYSFGVVLLELVTGKNPTQITPELDLVAWIRKQSCSDKGMQMVLDSRMDERYRADMVRVLRIGLLCTVTLPARRPSMREVVDLLAMCSLEEVGQHIISTANKRLPSLKLKEVTN